MPGEREPTLRLFVACPVPDEVKRGLASIQDDLRAAGFDRLRYVRPEGIHITLKFLGAVHASRVDEISAALERATQPFKLELLVEGVGGFGGGRMAGRVIWAGVRGEWEQLAERALRIEKALEGLGFPLETRPFRLHLTLARMPREMSDDRRRDLRRYLEAYKFPMLRPILVTEVWLMQSILGPGGAVYERLMTFPAPQSESA